MLRFCELKFSRRETNGIVSQMFHEETMNCFFSLYKALFVFHVKCFTIVSRCGIFVRSLGMKQQKGNEREHVSESVPSVACLQPSMFFFLLYMCEAPDRRLSLFRLFYCKRNERLICFTLLRSKPVKDKSLSP